MEPGPRHRGGAYEFREGTRGRGVLALPLDVRMVAMYMISTYSFRLRASPMPAAAASICAVRRVATVFDAVPYVPYAAYCRRNEKTG